MKKGIISAVLCIAAIFAFAITANAVDESFLQTHYGYSILTKADMKTAYKAIYEGVENYQTVIRFPGGITLTDDELLQLYQYYIHDCPEHCWLWGSSTTFSFGYLQTAADKNVGISLTYYGGTDSEKVSMRREFDAAVTRMLNNRTGTTKKEMALSLHDIVAQEVEYDMTNVYAHRAYGSIVGKRSVCDGYAFAYQVLLNKSGIRATTASGYGAKADGNKVVAEPHAWNIVEFEDNKWAYVDVTWDDHTDRTSSGLYHYYFGLNDSEMIAGVKTSHTQSVDVSKMRVDGTKDHYIVYEQDSDTTSGKVVVDIPYDLPACTSTRYKYFGSDKTFSSSSNARDVAKAIKKLDDDSAYGEFLFEGGTSAFKAWLEAGNTISLIKELDLSGTIKFGWSYIAQEIHLNVYVEGHEHQHYGGTATCLSRAVCSGCGQTYGVYGAHDYSRTCTHGEICKLCGEHGLNDEPDYTNHTYGELIARVPATPQTPGMKAHYECEECHKLFDEEKNWMESSDLIIPVYTPGDIDGNGVVNNKDVIMLFNYSVNKSLPGVIIDACNPDGEDGGLTNKDIIHLFKYVSRIKNIELH